MKKGRFITPVTLLSFAILCIFFACAGYGHSAFEFYYYWYPARRFPGDEDLGVFDAAMTAVMATLFAVVALLLLWWRRRIQRRLHGDRALGFPITINSTPPNPGPEKSD